MIPPAPGNRASMLAAAACCGKTPAAAARFAAAGEGSNGLPFPSKGFLPPATAAMYPPNDANGEGGIPPGVPGKPPCP